MRSFPPDNFRKSHSSGVRGLKVRCLLFNPEGSCSNRCVCAIFYQAFLSRRFHFFRHYETLFGFVSFFRKVFNVPKESSLQFLLFCNRTNAEKDQMVPSFSFFGTLRLLKILIFCFFFRKVFKVSKGSPFNFLKFCNRKNERKSQRIPPFTFFGIVRFFKMNIFRLKIRVFSGPARYIRFVFLKTRVFSMRLFSNLFSSKPPSVLLN